ncbi:MAG: hypothetical protein R2932_16555 [Caldilineaceae bacterium]
MKKRKNKKEYVAVLLRKRVDGFLLVPTASAASIQLIQRQQVPVVLLDRSIPDLSVDTMQ